MPSEGRGWGALQSALLLVVLAVALAGSGIDSTQASASGCADVIFIGARGSGEPLQVTKGSKKVTFHHGVGAPVDYMAQRLRADVSAYGETMRILPVVYSADSVDELVPSKQELIEMAVSGPVGAAATYYSHHVKPYLRSIDEGIDQAVVGAHAVLARCGGTELVLAGYSQGAMVVRQAELRLEREGDEDTLDAIGGTLLLGDGDRVPNTEARLIGGAPRGGEGVRAYLHGTGLRDVVEPETTAEICVTNDIVCDFDLRVGPGATSWYGAGAHVHSSYLKEPQRTYLDQAVDWLAQEMGLIAGRVARRSFPQPDPVASLAGPYGPEFRYCDSFRAGLRIRVYESHMSCRLAVRIQKEYWRAPDNRKVVVNGGSGALGYILLKRFPGWKCVSGSGGGSCTKHRKVAAYQNL